MKQEVAVIMHGFEEGRAVFCMGFTRALQQPNFLKASRAIPKVGSPKNIIGFVAVGRGGWSSLALDAVVACQGWVGDEVPMSGLNPGLS